MHDENEPSHEQRPDRLPDTLRNWQVLEVDSQATPVPDAIPESAPAPAPPQAVNRSEDLTGLQIGDRTDDLIVATLDNRRRQVECGATVEYAVTVLNNGPQAATFQVQIEGWIDPQWVGEGTSLVLIEPGRRAVLRLPLSPPRHAGSEAGDYHFAITVRSPHYPQRVARLGALLTLLPFDALDIRFLDLPDSVISWLHRAVLLPLSVTNRGNRAAEITLHGSDAQRHCRFAFGGSNGAGGAAALTLQPNQVITFPLRVEVRRPPLLGMHLREFEVQVEARGSGQASGQASGQVSGQVSAFARTELAARPLIGPWQMAAALGVAAAGAVTLTLVLALVYLLAQRNTVQQAAPAAAAPAVMAPPPVIIVTLNQQANETATTPVQGQGPATPSNFTAGAAPDPALPLVLPNQVSAPDGVAPAPAPAVVAASSAAPAAVLTADSGAASGQSANQTYGEMFRTVGSQFDLDWRMLAAQAYVESGFDSLALSDAGAMGLMQVLPNTWREWAPAVEVSDPFDAYSSVLVAAAYLDYLRQELAAKGYPESQWMLVAYNWGPDRLNDFLTSGGDWERLPEVRRQYASEILRIANSIP